MADSETRTELHGEILRPETLGSHSGTTEPLPRLSEAKPE
jgi:hypothetical protein